MTDPPDFRVAERTLEPDATPDETLDHLREHAAVLPVALDGLVPMWRPYGWHGTLDGRQVMGSLDRLDRFDEVTKGGILQSAAIERRGNWDLCVVVSATFGPAATVTVEAQAMTQEHADEIAEAVAEAWRRPPPPPPGTARLERAGHRATLRRTVRTGLRRSARFVGSHLVGLALTAALTALGVTAWLMGGVSWVLDL